MNKKGQLPESTFAIIDMTLILVVLIALLAFVVMESDGNSLRMNIISKDVSLTHNAMASIQGNAYVTYFAGETELSNKIIEFEPGFTLVYDKDKTATAYHPYFINSYLTELKDAIYEKPESLTIKKLGPILMRDVNGQIIDNQFEIACPEIATTKTSSIKVVLDPEHGGIDKGFESTNSPPEIESEIVFGISERIKTSLGAAAGAGISEIKLTRVGSPQTIVDESTRLAIVSDNTDVVISVGLGNDFKEDNKIKAFIPRKNANVNSDLREEKSRKLACLILNSLTGLAGEDIVFTGSSIITIEDDNMLNKNIEGVAVRLEVGNINNDKLLDYNTQQNYLAAGIAKGVTEYFKSPEE